MLGILIINFVSVSYMFYGVWIFCILLNTQFPVALKIGDNGLWQLTY